MQNTTHTQVIVIGGGLSGLTAAEQILRKSPTTKVTVLEANDRVGGRTYSKQLYGAFFDLGGMWVGPHQKYVIQMAKRAKESFIKQQSHGAKILQLNGKIEVYKSKIPKNVPILGLIQMQYYIYKIDRMAKTVPLQNPSLCPNAIQWDSMTVYTWIQNHIYFTKVKKLLQAAVRAIFGVQPSQISFLFFLWYTHQSKSFSNLIEIENGNQDRKLIYGSQYLSSYLQKQISKHGGKVFLNSPVRLVQRSNDKTIDVFFGENKLSCDYLIVAMPPVSVQRIEFIPKLSRQRQFICQKNFMGSIIKILIFYKNRFWKDKKFSGQTLSDCLNSPVFNAYDDSRPNQKGQYQSAIVVFVNAAVSRYWGNLQSMKSRTLQKLAQYFGQQALEPIDVHIQNWDNQPYIRGGPVGNFPTGTLSQIGKMTIPQYNIHWAGTELAYHSQGFMDGAIQSGQRVAKQILTEIKKIKQNCIQASQIDNQQSEDLIQKKQNWMISKIQSIKQTITRIFKRSKYQVQVPYQKNITSERRWFNTLI